MSQENVALLHQAIDAFNRRDLDAFLVLCDPDVEFISYLARVKVSRIAATTVSRTGGEPPRRLPRLHSRDRAGTRPWRSYDCPGACTRPWRQSDAPMTQTMWQVAEYRHGKTIGWRFFTSEAEVLEAAGLSE